MIKLLEILGVFVVACIGGLAGAFALVWGPQLLLTLPPCHSGSACRVLQLLDSPRANSNKSCPGIEDAKAIAQLTALLLDSRPLDSYTKKIVDAIGVKQGECGNIAAMARNACVAAEGGNLRSIPACDQIGSDRPSAEKQ